jgi:hypothetical protein
MRASVRSAFLAFTAPLEGAVSYLYADILGLITTGYGNLVDPVATAMGLDWVFPDGRAARGDEISAAWWAVKNDPHARVHGHLYARGLTKIRLTARGLEKLVFGKLDANDRYLAKRFPDWEEWPADAQLGTMSLAWACGPAFRFPILEADLRARDFEQAGREQIPGVPQSAHCHMNDDHNPGLRPRNVANKILFRNAARVLGMHLDPEELVYPANLAALEQDAIVTVTELPNPPSGETVLVEPGTIIHPRVPLGLPDDE